MDSRTLFRTCRRHRKAGRPEEARGLLREALRRHQLDAHELERAGRFLHGCQTVEPLPHVRFLGQCTTEWLAMSLNAVSLARGLPMATSWGEYDSVVPEALALVESAQPVDTVVLLPWLRDLLSRDGRSVQQQVADTLEHWRGVWEVLARRPGLRIIQVGLDAMELGPAGVHAGASQGALAVAREASRALQEHLPEGAYFVDLERVAGDVGRRHFYDQRQYRWAKQPFSAEGLQCLAEHIHAGARAQHTGPRKVLVLDLDDTLWGGVVGEEGPLGVRLGEDPEGEAYRGFQAWCKALSKRGILLAVASKNNEADAREPFERNPSMVLTLDDIAAFEAHWQPKALSMERIARALNLGLDSLVFMDDNPAEREQVRQALPMVEVVETPEDPAEYISAIEAGLYFEAVSLTDADRVRAGQYKAEARRQEAKASFAGLDAYWRSLEMRGQVRRVDEGDLPRVVQLVGKTNQFNLTTRRHTGAQVAAWAADPEALCLSLRVRDRFGDHGLVSVMLAVPDESPGTLRIDTWLMSCRVIARTVEQFFFAALVQRARSQGSTRLVGEYIPSAKNSQVADLYERLGFQPLPESDANIDRWELMLNQAEPPKHYVEEG